MSDLIDRNRILNMTGEGMKKMFGSDGGIYISVSDLMKFIKEIPTAYDADKVVEQIEELRKECEDPLEEYCPNYFIDRAVEFVKAGGINE